VPTATTGQQLNAFTYAVSSSFLNARQISKLNTEFGAIMIEYEVRSSMYYFEDV
jgi:hypothetical protein